jgi:gas vesicle protein
MYREDTSKTAMAFIAGATVGAGVMLLSAPQSGSEFRSSMSDYTRRAKDEWDHASERGVSSLEVLFRRGKEWLQRTITKQGEERGTPNGERAIGSAQSRTGEAGDTGQDN